MAKRDLAGVRLLVVQYAGDYAEAWHRLRSGGNENYFAQAYSVDAIERLATRGAEVTVLVAVTPTAYRETLLPGLTAIGLGLTGFDARAERTVIGHARALGPTHLLLRSPFARLLCWASDAHVRTLLTLADSFPSGLKSWLRTRNLARQMNRPQVDWVANHGLPACKALVRIGVDPRKVIPWDWPHVQAPVQRPAKELATGRGFRLLYVGARLATKGVGDAIQAVGLARARGLDVSLDVIGEGDDFVSLVARNGISANVRFRGRLPNSAVIPEMTAADAIIVPSRHDYPEGFPLTIFEALSSRTPIIASDHPMFIDYLHPDRSAVLFPAADFVALANAIARLLRSPQLYLALSRQAVQTWDELQISTKWQVLVESWLENGNRNKAWLQDHALESSTMEFR